MFIIVCVNELVNIYFSDQVNDMLVKNCWISALRHDRVMNASGGIQSSKQVAVSVMSWLINWRFRRKRARVL